MIGSTMYTGTQQTNANIMAFLAFFVGCVLTVLPILHNPFLPLVDLPNHIARHYIATMPAGPLDVYYDYDVSLVPNSAVDFVWILLGGDMDPAKFSQLVLAFYCISFVGSTMVLSRVLHGHWSAWPAAAALVCYNSNFFWGFQNYIFSVPFAIFGLALWFWTERLKTAHRILILAPIVFALYVMHFFAFAFLAFAVFGREVQRILEAGKNWKAQILEATLLSVPFLLPIVWLLIDLATGPANPAGTFSSLGVPFRRLEIFLSAVGGVDQILPVAIRITGAATFLILVPLALSFFSTRMSGKLKVAPQMRGSIIALCAIAVVMPFSLNGVAYLHIRFPFVIAALFFAATQWRDMPSRHLKAIAVFIFALILARSVAFDRYASMHSAEVKDFIAITDSVPAGERLFPLRLEVNQEEVRLRHITAYATTYRDVFVPTLFLGLHSLKLKPEWLEYATPAYHTPPLRLLLRDWSTTPVYPLYEFIQNWDEKYSYLIFFDNAPEELEQFDALEQISTRGRFTLYRIGKAQ